MDISFSEVTTLLNSFLGDIWNAIINGEEWFKNWRCSELSWHNKT